MIAGSDLYNRRSDMRTVGICAFLLGSLLMAQTPGKLTPDQIVDEALAHNARILADR